MDYRSDCIQKQNSKLIPKVSTLTYSFYVCSHWCGMPYATCHKFVSDAVMLLMICLLKIKV